MIKVSEFIEQHKKGNVSKATLIKMAVFKAELEKTGVAPTVPAAAVGLGEQIFNSMRYMAPSVLAGGATLGLGALIFEAVRGIEKAWMGYKLDAIKEPKFLEMLDKHPELNVDKDTRGKAALYFDSLWHFSPAIAQDPLAAGSYIKQAIQFHHVAQGPLPELVQRTTEIQKNISQGTPRDEYSTPMGAVFLSMKPQAGSLYGKSMSLKG